MKRCPACGGGGEVVSLYRSDARTCLACDGAGTVPVQEAELTPGERRRLGLPASSGPARAPQYGESPLQSVQADLAAVAPRAGARVLPCLLCVNGEELVAGIGWIKCRRCHPPSPREVRVVRPEGFDLGAAVLTAGVWLLVLVMIAAAFGLLPGLAAWLSGWLS